MPPAGFRRRNRCPHHSVFPGILITGSPMRGSVFFLLPLMGDLFLSGTSECRQSTAGAASQRARSEPSFRPPRIPGLHAEKELADFQPASSVSFYCGLFMILPAGPVPLCRASVFMEGKPEIRSKGTSPCPAGRILSVPAGKTAPEAQEPACAALSPPAMKPLHRAKVSAEMVDSM